MSLKGVCKLSETCVQKPDQIPQNWFCPQKKESNPNSIRNGYLLLEARNSSEEGKRPEFGKGQAVEKVLESKRSNAKIGVATCLIRRSNKLPCPRRRKDRKSQTRPPTRKAKLSNSCWQFLKSRRKLPKPPKARSINLCRRSRRWRTFLSLSIGGWRDWRTVEISGEYWASKRSETQEQN